jgi:ribonuclease J
MAALSRMANGDHKIQIEQDDTVVLASSLIPGNENSVFRVINGLMRLGANVVHKGNAKVHVSGHAAAGELLYCYNILKPKNVMPVHGEIRHLIANAELAIETGIDPEGVLVCEDGAVVDLVDGKARVVGAIPNEYVYVDGRSVGEVTEDDLKDRRILGEEGFISIVTVIDRDTKRVVTGPDVHARGVAEDDSVFDDITPKITAALEDALHMAPEKIHTTHQLQQIVRRTIGSWVARRLRRKPMIIPVVVDTPTEED